MPSPHRPSTWARALAVTAAGAAAAAFTLVPLSAQAAASLTGTVGSAATFDEGGATCSGTGGAESTTTFTDNGQSRTRSSSSDGTITNSGDVTDNTAWQASAKTTVKASQGSDALTFTSVVEASVDAELGTATDCDPEAEAIGQVEALLAVDAGGWLTVEASLPRSSVLVISLVPVAGGGGLPVVIVNADQGSYSGKLWVEGGQYVLQVTAQGLADADPGTTTRASMVGTVRATLAVQGAGQAKNNAAGPAKAYVALPSSVNCGNGTVAVPFTKKADDASSATFYVNGKKKAKISNPQPGTAVVLKGVGARSSTVKVVVEPPQGKSVAVTRSYLACS